MRRPRQFMNACGVYAESFDLSRGFAVRGPLTKCWAISTCSRLRRRRRNLPPRCGWLAEGMHGSSAVTDGHLLLARRNDGQAVTFDRGLLALASHLGWLVQLVGSSVPTVKTAGLIGLGGLQFSPC